MYFNAQDGCTGRACTDIASEAAEMTAQPLT